MSESSASELASELREATLGYVWRQWRSMGATTSTVRPARAIVDPEPLILMSLCLLPYEERLADIVWSWTSVNARLVSIQRLGNLQPAFPAETGQQLSSLAALQVRETNEPRWKSLTRPKAAPLSARQGKVRAIEARFGSWATLMLQLRMGMGVSVKADVLGFLLGTSTFPSEWASVAMIADALRYTPAAVRRAADDLARARFILALGTAEFRISPQRSFSASAEGWSGLLGITVDQPGWVYWLERYLFLIDVLGWLERESGKPAGTYARNVKARDLLTKHALVLRNDRLIDPHEFASADLGYDYLLKATKAFIVWFENRG